MYLIVFCMKTVTHITTGSEREIPINVDIEFFDFEFQYENSVIDTDIEQLGGHSDNIENSDVVVVYDSLKSLKKVGLDMDLAECKLVFATDSIIHTGLEQKMWEDIVTGCDVEINVYVPDSRFMISYPDFGNENVSIFVGQIVDEQTIDVFNMNEESTDIEKYSFDVCYYGDLTDDESIDTFIESVCELTKTMEDEIVDVVLCSSSLTGEREINCSELENDLNTRSSSNIFVSVKNPRDLNTEYGVIGSSRIVLNPVVDLDKQHYLPTVFANAVNHNVYAPGCGSNPKFCNENKLPNVDVESEEVDNDDDVELGKNQCLIHSDLSFKLSTYTVAVDSIVNKIHSNETKNKLANVENRVTDIDSVVDEVFLNNNWFLDEIVNDESLNNRIEGFDCVYGFNDDVDHMLAPRKGEFSSDNSTHGGITCYHLLSDENKDIKDIVEDYSYTTNISNARNEVIKIKNDCSINPSVFGFDENGDNCIVCYEKKIVEKVKNIDLDADVYYIPEYSEIDDGDFTRVTSDSDIDVIKYENMDTDTGNSEDASGCKIEKFMCRTNTSIIFDRYLRRDVDEFILQSDCDKIVSMFDPVTDTEKVQDVVDMISTYNSNEQYPSVELKCVLTGDEEVCDYIMNNIDSKYITKVSDESVTYLHEIAYLSNAVFVSEITDSRLVSYVSHLCEKSRTPMLWSETCSYGERISGVDDFEFDKSRNKELNQIERIKQPVTETTVQSMFSYAVIMNTCRNTDDFHNKTGIEVLNISIDNFGFVTGNKYTENSNLSHDWLSMIIGKNNNTESILQQLNHHISYEYDVIALHGSTTPTKDYIFLQSLRDFTTKYDEFDIVYFPYTSQDGLADKREWDSLLNYTERGDVLSDITVISGSKRAASQYVDTGENRGAFILSGYTPGIDVSVLEEKWVEYVPDTDIEYDFVLTDTLFKNNNAERIMRVLGNVGNEIGRDVRVAVAYITAPDGVKYVTKNRLEEMVQSQRKEYDIEISNIGSVNVDRFIDIIQCSYGVISQSTSPRKQINPEIIIANSVGANVFGPDWGVCGEIIDNPWDVEPVVENSEYLSKSLSNIGVNDVEDSINYFNYYRSNSTQLSTVILNNDGVRFDEVKLPFKASIEYVDSLLTSLMFTESRDFSGEAERNGFTTTVRDLLVGTEIDGREEIVVDGGNVGSLCEKDLFEYVENGYYLTNSFLSDREYYLTETSYYRPKNDESFVWGGNDFIEGLSDCQLPSSDVEDIISRHRLTYMNERRDEDSENILHLSEDMNVPGSLDDFIESTYDDCVNHQLCIGNPNEVYELNNLLSEYDVIVIHNYVELISTLDAISCTGTDSDTEVVYIPHANKYGQNWYEYWKNTIPNISYTLNIVIGSPRCIPLFPDYESGNVDIHIGPTMGVRNVFTEQQSEALNTSEMEYDLLYYGKVSKEKAPDRVLEVANKLSEQLDREIRVAVPNTLPASDVEYWANVKREYVNNDVTVEEFGFLTDQELLELIGDSEVLCFPQTMVAEQWAAVGWEAATLGKPAVVSNWAALGDVAEQVDNIYSVSVVESHSGFLNFSVESDYSIDIDEATEKCVELLTNSESNVIDDPELLPMADSETLVSILTDISQGRESSFQVDNEHVVAELPENMFETLRKPVEDVIID